MAQTEEGAPIEACHGVLDLSDVLSPETKRPDQAWCPGSRRVLDIDDCTAVCPACGAEWHGIGSTRAALPRHLPWMLRPELGAQPDQADAAAPSELAQADYALDAGATAAPESAQPRQARAELAAALDSAGPLPEGCNLMIGDDGKAYPIVLWPSDGGG